MAMYIKNDDLELLRTICADLDRAAHSMLDADMIKRSVDLEILVEQLEQHRDVSRKKTAELVREKRNTDPTYGRSKADIEKYKCYQRETNTVVNEMFDTWFGDKE